MKRREFLGLTAGGVLVAASGCVAPVRRRMGRSAATGISRSDREFLESLGRASFQYFVDAAHPRTGQVLDRRRADAGAEERRVASIAATGFGLTAWCGAVDRGWCTEAEVAEVVGRTLRHLLEDQEHVRGFFYHFHDWETGERVWRCELSSIDTAILMCGVLACRARLGGRFPEIRRMADALYERVEWPWMLNGADTFSMGWMPERGFLDSRWDHYSELMMLYLLAMGSPTHPVEAGAWRAWARPVRGYEGERFVWCPAPLFIHQYSHAWFDFGGWKDGDGTDWWENSVAATRAHRSWSLAQRDRFPLWSEDLWGVTSSDSVKGYVAWGGPPEMGPLDGTVVPCAAAGSLPFLPEACLRTLRHQREAYGHRVWGRYGFVDAFNPHTGWVNPDVIGIDVGITALMVENLRSGRIWHWMGMDPAVQRGWKAAGFRRELAG